MRIERGSRECPDHGRGEHRGDFSRRGDRRERLRPGAERFLDGPFTGPICDRPASMSPRSPSRPEQSVLPPTIPSIGTRDHGRHPDLCGRDRSARRFRSAHPVSETSGRRRLRIRFRNRDALRKTWDSCVSGGCPGLKSPPPMGDDQVKDSGIMEAPMRKTICYRVRHAAFTGSFGLHHASGPGWSSGSATRAGSGRIRRRHRRRGLRG